MSNPLSDYGVSDRDYAAAIGTAMGEANREGVAGMAAVMDVLANRAQDPTAYGSRDPSLAGVAFGTRRGGMQFDTWNPNVAPGQYRMATDAQAVALNPSLLSTMSPAFRAQYEQAVEAAYGVLGMGTLRGIAQGATFYRNAAETSVARNLEHALRGGNFTIGAHTFSGGDLSLRGTTNPNDMVAAHDQIMSARGTPSTGLVAPSAPETPSWDAPGKSFFSAPPESNVQSWGDYNELDTAPAAPAGAVERGPDLPTLDTAEPPGWTNQIADRAAPSGAVSFGDYADPANGGSWGGTAGPGRGDAGYTPADYTTGGVMDGWAGPAAASSDFNPATSFSDPYGGNVSPYGFGSPVSEAGAFEGGGNNFGGYSPLSQPTSVSPYGFSQSNVSSAYQGNPVGWGTYDDGTSLANWGAGVDAGKVAAAAPDSWGGYQTPAQAFGALGPLSQSMPRSITSYETVSVPRTTQEAISPAFSQRNQEARPQFGAIGPTSFGLPYKSPLDVAPTPPTSVAQQRSTPQAPRQQPVTRDVPQSVAVTRTVSQPVSAYQNVVSQLSQGGTPKGVAQQVAEAYTSRDFNPTTWSGISAPQGMMQDFGWAGKGIYDAKSNAFLGNYDPSDPAYSPSYVTTNYPYGFAGGDTSGTGLLGDAQGNTYNLGFNPGQAATDINGWLNAMGYGGGYGGGMASGWGSAEPGQGYGGANWN